MGSQWRTRAPNGPLRASASQPSATGTGRPEEKPNIRVISGHGGAHVLNSQCEVQATWAKDATGVRRPRAVLGKAAGKESMAFSGNLTHAKSQREGDRKPVLSQPSGWGGFPGNQVNRAGQARDSLRNQDERGTPAKPRERVTEGL